MFTPFMTNLDTREHNANWGVSLIDLSRSDVAKFEYTWDECFATKVFKVKSVYEIMSKKGKGAPLPASSAGLLRFFEDETKGHRIDPRIVVTIPIGLIVVSWAIEIASKLP